MRFVLFVASQTDLAYSVVFYVVVSTYRIPMVNSSLIHLTLKFKIKFIQFKIVRFCNG